VKIADFSKSPKSREKSKSRSRPNSRPKVGAIRLVGFAEKVACRASWAVSGKFADSRPEVKAGQGFPGRNSGKSNRTGTGEPSRKTGAGLKLELFEKVALRRPWTGIWKSQGNDLAGEIEAVTGGGNETGRHTGHTGRIPDPCRD
jgi:hypothetical protein